MPDTSRDPAAKAETVIVGVGASAGGLEALRKMLRALDRSVPAAYIVAQHMSPTHASMLVDILRKESTLEVADATNGLEPRAGVFYITPPNANIELRNGRIQLTQPVANTAAPKPSVDALFQSLAEEYGPACVGVVLSGTGTDGTAGLMDIRAAGGLTIAQDPSTCQYDGMPISAIESGAADLRCPPEEIGQIVQQLVSLDPTPLDTGKDESTLDRILGLIERSEGVRLRQYKHSSIERRVRRRMSVRQTPTLEDYLAYLTDDPSEARELVKDVFISVTEFFRDRPAFESLLTLLKEVFRNRPKRDVVRIWVPGCATGQEAYTVAILCDQARHEVASPAGYQIFATDISARVIDVARRGRYGREIVDQVPEALRETYFIEEEEGFLVRPQVRDHILFSVHDLARDPPFARLDLITCRNVLIYFNTALQDRVIAIFNYALSDEGYLMLGRSESAARWPDRFSDYDNKYRLYRKVRGAERPRFASEPLSYGMGAASPSQSASPPRRVGESDILRRLFYEKCVSLFVPVTVAIDQANEILFSRGDIGTFTAIREGKATLNLLDLVAEDIRPVLRALIYRVRRTAIAVARSEHVRTDENGHRVRVMMEAHDFAELRPGTLLVSLTRQDTVASVDNGAQHLEDDQTRPIIRELESELTSTRENLQTVVEELETTNEELQASNEELQSANEELQATNEELQTSNEELQSSNEELRTLNEELNVKNLQLEQLSNDLMNIERGIGIPLIVLGADLRVLRYSADIDQVLRLNNMQLGDPESSLLWRFDRTDNFSAELQQRIESHSSDRMLVRAEDRWFDLRISPYLDLHNQVQGLVLSFVDVSELRSAIGTLREERQRALDTLGAAETGILMTDTAGIVQYANRLAADIVGVEADALIGQPLEEALPLPDPSGKAGTTNLARLAIETAETLRSDGPVPLATRDGDCERVTYAVAPILKAAGTVAGAVITFDTVD